jgi:hypothetical protein
MTGAPSFRGEVLSLKRNDMPRSAWRLLAHRYAMLAPYG